MREGGLAEVGTSGAALGVKAEVKDEAGRDSTTTVDAAASVTVTEELLADAVDVLPTIKPPFIMTGIIVVVDVGVDAPLRISSRASPSLSSSSLIKSPMSPIEGALAE